MLEIIGAKRETLKVVAHILHDESVDGRYDGRVEAQDGRLSHLEELLIW